MKKPSSIALTLALPVLISPSVLGQLKIVYGNNAGFGPDIVEKFDVSSNPASLLDTFSPSGGNGRGVVVVGDVAYTTVVGDPHIYKTDVNTHASLGSILTGAASMSTIAWDGSHFWTTDYTGSNRGFRIDTSGTIVKTVTFANATGFMDGMEYFNGKLIVNRTDGGFGGPIKYDIYDTDGNLLDDDFLTAPNGTGIAFDGTNFLVSNIYGNEIGKYDGTTGAFIESISLPGSHLIEDLSVNYEERPDTGGGGVVPEASTVVSAFALTGLIGTVVWRRARSR